MTTIRQGKSNVNELYSPMPPETKITCETKKHLSFSEKLAISFVCHQEPHNLQPNQIYGNLVTNIPKY
jgi:hypothetical protein